MKTIGMTGGVGAGKTQVLSHIEKHCNCRVLLADLAAHAVEQPGQPCYDRLLSLLGEGILRGDGEIDRGKMAALIFADAGLLAEVNAVVHPAVKTYILEEIDAEKKRGLLDAFFVEAALLIEDGYGQILDELWYVRANRDVRAQRLRTSRQYSEEKIAQIFASQLAEEDFLAHCKVVIDNSGSLADTYRQIDDRLKEAGLYR